MIRLRQACALLSALVFVPPLAAQDKAASPWLIDRELTVSPQPAPVPALKYRLLALSSALKPGNAVPIYLRLAHQQNDAARKYWTETPKTWNLLPVDRLPRDEVRKFLQEHRYLLHQLEVGARRRSVEWDYTFDEPNPIGLLMPDVQSMRDLVPMVNLQARLALAEKDFAGAAHHLQTGFAFSRHVATGPTLISKMVGMAMAGQFAVTVADFIAQPEAPNLYWALTALPRPLIPLRSSVEWEYRILEMQMPELADLDRPRTAEQWDEVLRRVRTEMRDIVGIAGEGSSRKLPAWFPKSCDPAMPAAGSPDLPAARAFVARSKHLSAAQVEALPPAQVLLLFMVGTYQEQRDAWFVATHLSYSQARPLLAANIKRLKDAPSSEANVPARVVLPGLDRVMARQAALERDLAALRVIEALRLHAAAHDGKLPAKLDEVTEVPLPNDPGTGRSFDYHLDGATATLISQVPDDPFPRNGIRYRVTIRK
jgi:hypothetical protein